MFSNGAVFNMDVCVQDLMFKIRYVVLTDNLSIGKHCTHNNEQFGGCLIKIKQILSILQRFKKSLCFLSAFKWGDF